MGGWSGLGVCVCSGGWRVSAPGGGSAPGGSAPGGLYPSMH